MEVLPPTPADGECLSKSVINVGLREALAAAIDGSLAYAALSNSTPEQHAAVEALLNRRKPIFTSTSRSWTGGSELR
jgi:hypothetical protein